MASDNEFSQTLSSFPDFDTQELVQETTGSDEKPTPTVEYKGPTQELVQETTGSNEKPTPTVEYKGPEPRVTPSMLDSIAPFSIVKLVGFIGHVLMAAEGPIPAHVRFRAAGGDGELAVYGLLETMQYRYKAAEAKDGESLIMYEMRAVVLGGRCVLPVQWTMLPSLGGTEVEALDSLRAIGTTIKRTHDPRFVHMFGSAAPAPVANGLEGAMSVESEGKRAWNDLQTRLDEYSIWY
ncbi:hypothetical protein AURDEDRAFT_176643 [Auricularia subglabra TFB-10046 SS5]|uniref:Uncharacterized protein n=1 Tax=Auricularia subglabra (strain TFB-10046 / SS5) TaxID=717982 RepID=J0CV79_AURST|nr:hypothetical protein AURDEDRAFT_176643 [Auricularia subglabra TFB-10046 SS5]